jgi:choline monooxygenase
MPHRLGTFENDLARAATLPAIAYTDPAILAAEQERIFRRCWEPVGNAVDVALPGSFLTAEVAGAPIVVTRDAGGVLRGFFNVCRHRAGPVATGKGARKSLTCRYHGWTYALDGRLVTTPELGDVKDFDRGCHGLRPVRVETWGPLVFACLDEAAPPLLAILGGIPGETATHDLAAMKPVARREYEVACNWKVYVDNFLEGYHLPTVHPGLFRELDYGKYRVETFAGYSSQIAPIRPAGGDAPKDKDRYYTPDDGELAALYYWVFPGWMLNIYPDNMSLNVVLPRGPDRCVTVFEWFRKDPDAPGAADAIARTIEFSHGIQVEDIAICEVVQKGLASGAYERGRFSMLRENGVHHFQSLVHAALTRG